MAGTGNMNINASAQMPLLSHLQELRRCLIISAVALAAGFGIAISLYNLIMDFLFEPLLQLTKGTNGEILYINTLAEGFLVRLKISALAGFIISLPVHLFNILYFVFPGLVKREKQIIITTLICSFLFVAGGFFYSYYSIIPVSVVFLTGKGFIPDNTGMLLSFGGNIFYILQFILMTLVVFQLPVLLEILLVLNVLNRKTLFKLGRYMVVLFFLISAMLTPPDFVTQIGLALPMTVLFYLTILVAKIFKFGEE
jgi:sec-independent protein translocase protein TatC